MDSGIRCRGRTGRQRFITACHATSTDSAPKPGDIWLFSDVFRPRKEWTARSKLRSRSECHSKLQRRSIEWPEPFGLVMIEAIACGTPVVAYRGGAVPELVEPGHTGFIVEGLEDAVEAVRRVAGLSRKRCREVFEQRFTATRMAHDYVQQFEHLIARNEEVSEAA